MPLLLSPVPARQFGRSPAYGFPARFSPKSKVICPRPRRSGIGSGWPVATRASWAASQFGCYSAVTYQKTAQPQKADAALNKVGSLTLVDSFRFHGDVQDLRGDWEGAQAWYQKAVELAPSLPAGYYSWGVALARHGDFAGAAAKLQLANQKGPHWADPLKAWGDVALKLGRGTMHSSSTTRRLSTRQTGCSSRTHTTHY